MTLRHLKIFIKVADAGSMTAAAEALYVSQPTVSQAIIELESHYGVKLFDRLSKRLYITELGKQFLSYARHIASLFDEMEQQLKNPDQTGVLKVGASITIGTFLLPEWVKSFNKEYPTLHLQVVVRNTKEIEGMLLSNNLDFGIVEGHIHSNDIHSEPLMEDELVCVCGEGHPWFESTHEAVNLEEGAFIVREVGSGTRELFESVMTAHDLRTHIVWECSDSEGIKQAAISGIGIGVISRRLVKNEVNEGVLRVLKAKNIEFKRKFCIVHHKNKYLTPAIQCFFESIKVGSV